MIQGKAYLIDKGDEKEMSKTCKYDRNNNNVPSVKKGHDLIYQKYTQYQK